MWSGKFMARSGIKIYHVLLTGAKKIPADGAYKTEGKGVSALKILSFTAYDELILAQKDTVWFNIVEEAKTKVNKQEYEILVWMKLSRKLDPTIGACKKRLLNKFAKCKLYDITSNHKEWKTKRELLIEYLQKEMYTLTNHK